MMDIQKENQRHIHEMLDVYAEMYNLVQDLLISFGSKHEFTKGETEMVELFLEKRKTVLYHFKQLKKEDGSPVL